MFREFFNKSRKMHSSSKLLLLDEPRKPVKYRLSIQEIVEYSFILQKSVTCLDLSLGEFSGFKSKFYPFGDLILINGKLGISTASAKNAVLTEEAFRKSFAPDRKLLYDYHLDVSYELEWSLRNATGKDIRPFYSSSILINMTEFHFDKYEIDIIPMLSKTLRTSNQKLKVLNQISKMAKCLKFRLNDEYILKKGFNILCFQGADSTAVVDFLTVIDLYDDQFLCLFIDVFKFLLHQANEARFNLWALQQTEMINGSIYFKLFQRTEIILQYRDAPRFCTTLYDDLKKNSSIRFLKEGRDCPVKNGLISKERHFLVLQMLDVFWEQSPAGLKALQMLWRSIPDAFLTVYDLDLVCNIQQNSEFIEEVCGFMENVTGDKVIQERKWEPRKLKHYCRIVIRRALSKNFQLSTGIDELKLPSALECFLRLEH